MSRSFLLSLFVTLLVISSSFIQAVEPETWKPSDHPAALERTITAFTRPRRQLDISAEVSGRVKTVRVDVGNRITGDDPVVVIDDTQALIARDLAESGLRAAQQAATAASLLAESAEQESGLRARTAGLWAMCCG